MPIISHGFAQTGPGGVEQTNGSSALAWWVKADEGVYEDTGTDVAESGDGVNQWNDASGSNLHIQQTTALNRPTFTTNVLNGQPVIRFESANEEYFEAISADFFQNNYSIFLVGYASGASQSFIAVTFPTDHGILVEQTNLSTFRFLHRNPVGASGGNSLYGSTTLNTTTSQVLSCTRGTPSGGTQQTWINGADNESITGSEANFSSTGSLVLGRLGAAYSSRHLDGDIAEVIVMSKEVNAAERIIIENYLAAKYGLTLGANDLDSRVVDDDVVVV
ncbi:MAG: hypothetical protein AAF193_03325, partial [Bacteroidota bacterium]